MRGIVFGVLFLGVAATGAITPQAAAGACTVSIGYCVGNGHCTVNVGYCDTNGRCLVDVGYCDGSCTIAYNYCGRGSGALLA